MLSLGLCMVDWVCVFGCIGFAAGCGCVGFVFLFCRFDADSACDWLFCVVGFSCACFVVVLHVFV